MESRLLQAIHAHASPFLDRVFRVSHLIGTDLTRGARPRVRALALGLAALLCLLIGIGRVYLGVHWPSDVLAGWALGGVQLLVAVRVLRSYEKSVDLQRPDGGSH